MRQLASALLFGGLLLAACGSSDQRCPQVSCPAGLECVEGECVELGDPCEGVVCNPNATCQDRLGAAFCVCDDNFVADLAACPDLEACGPGELFCAPACHVTACDEGFCDSDTGLCVECRNDADCLADHGCEEGSCVSTICVPKTCDELGAQCGAPSNGCGEALDCGGCAAAAKHCDIEHYTCVDCIQDVDCGDGNVCRVDDVLGPGVCMRSCRGEADCTLTGVCIEGACRPSFCGPSGSMGGASVEETDYGSPCSLFGPDGEERYRGFCLGPVRHGALVGGLCHRVGDRGHGESCFPAESQGVSDYDLCDGVCFRIHLLDSVCLPTCHPGECRTEFCASFLAGLLGVCLPSWDGTPQPLGSGCEDASIEEILTSCGEGRICIDGMCREACAPNREESCGDGSVCRELRNPADNETIGWCL